MATLKNAALIVVTAEELFLTMQMVSNERSRHGLKPANGNSLLRLSDREHWARNRLEDRLPREP